MAVTRLRPALLACALLLLAGGCISRPVKQEIFEEGMTRVYLRSDVRWTTPVPKGYDHPAAIAPVRLSRILSRIDVRPPEGWLPSFGEDRDRVPAVDTEQLETLAAALSEALAEAAPHQEAVVMAVRETKRWGLFDHDYLTSFVAYVRDGRLHLHFNHFDWDIPRRDQRLPEPRIGRHPQRFELYPGTALVRLDEQSVAVDWRDPVFERDSRMEMGAGGEMRRREILEETPPEELPPPLDALPEGLTPAQLRALADLEERRRAGEITEAEYRTRRREIAEEER